MSKLSKALIIALVMICAGVYAAQAFAKKSHEQVAKQPPSWGKAKAPVLTRIVDSFNDDVLTLEGQINTDYSNVSVEWILPSGVQLVEGQLQQQLNHPARQIVSHTIKIRKPASMESSQVMFRAYESQSGHSSNTIYEINPDPEEKEMVDTVKDHFRARGNSYIK